MKETEQERTNRVLGMIEFHKKRIEQQEQDTNNCIGAMLYQQDKTQKSIQEQVRIKTSLVNQANALQELESNPSSIRRYNDFLDQFIPCLVDTTNTSVQCILNKDIILKYLENLIGWDNIEFLGVKSIIEKYYNQL